MKRRFEGTWGGKPGVVGCVATLLLIAVAGVAAAQEAKAGVANPTDLIANAESAAPKAIAKDATVLGWPAKMGDHFSVLRKGSNGWTCLPDRSVTPANDPMCVDDVWMEWMNAAMESRPAKIDHVGLAYMLQGGWAPSQRNPMQVEAGKDAYFVGPHVMVILPNPEDLKGVSRNVHNGGPFVEALDFDHPVILMPVAAPGTVLSIQSR